MTAQEFSNEFDILYNNIMSNQAPGLDEYEKSVFLTQAQENVVKSYYEGNNTGLGPFENTEVDRRELSNLIITTKLDSSNINSFVDTQIGGVSWKLPDDVLYIIQEYYQYDDMQDKLNVVPVTNDELQKIKKNPFRGPSKDRVLRLDYNNNSVILIIENSRNTLGGDGPYYGITYLKKPYPIILTDLTDAKLSVNNETTPFSTDTPCELSSSIHRLILTQAVALAAAAYKS